MIGKVASNAADCMEVAANRPGARNARYDTPPSEATEELDTYDPRPNPIAVRNRAGDRNEEKIDARKVRRYCRNRCSKTRAAVEFGRASAIIVDPYSINDRPVRRRKTSSSEERLTRTVS